MKKKITNNLGLKILALLFSIALWFAIVNISDPVSSEPFSDVAVTILNASSVSNQGKVYTVLEKSDHVSVRVYAKRSILDNLTSSDITVTADLEDLTFLNTVTYEVSFGRYEGEIDRYVLSTDNLKLAIEDVKNIQLKIAAKTEGAPAEGYVIGDITLDQNLVRLSGGESVINQIASVEVLVNVEGWTGTISTQSSLRYLDSEGNVVTDSQIVSNINSVNATINILETKTVPLVFEMVGTAAEGYAMTGEVTSSIQEVTIAGKSSVISKISELLISGTALNITGQNRNMVAVVDLAEYLPSGIQFADSSFDSRATVTAYIEKEISRAYAVDASRVTVRNVPLGYTVSILMTEMDNEDNTIGLEVRGVSQILNTIEASTLRAVIDVEAYMEENELTELEPGIYSMDYTMDLIEGARQVEDSRISVVVSRVSSEVQ